MAKEPSKREGGIFGGKGSLKEDLRDISGDDKITFADTWLGDLLGFDGKAGVQGANLKESWYGARRRPYRERAKEVPSLERAAKKWVESRQQKEEAQESLRRSFDDKAAATDRAIRSMSRERTSLTDDDMGLPEGYISTFSVRPDVPVGRNTTGLMARRQPVDIISVEKGYEKYDPEAKTLTYKGVDLTNLPDTKEDFLDLIRAGKGKLEELGLFGLTISDYAKARAAKERILGKTSGTAAAPKTKPKDKTKLAAAWEYNKLPKAEAIEAIKADILGKRITDTTRFLHIVSQYSKEGPDYIDSKEWDMLEKLLKETMGNN